MRDTIVQITDMHVVERGELLLGQIDTAGFLQQAVIQIESLDPAPSLVIATGDLVNDGLPEQYEHLAALLEPLAGRLLLLPGNHDRLDAMWSTMPAELLAPPDLRRRPGGADGVLDRGIRVIALDSSRPPNPGGWIAPEQLDWLDDELAAQPSVRTVIAVHHPPFLTGIDHMDAMGMDSHDATAFEAVVARHPQVGFVACGHLHRRITRRWANATAFTTPSVAHGVAFDLSGGPATWTFDPPAFSVVLAEPQRPLVEHLVHVGSFPGGPF